MSPFRAVVFLREALLLIPLVLAAGCAEEIGLATQTDVAELRDEVSRVRQDVVAVRAVAQQSRSQPQAPVQADRQGRDQQADLQQQLGRLQSKTDGLSVEVRRLSSRIEQLSQETAARGKSEPVDADIKRLTGRVEALSADLKRLAARVDEISQEAAKRARQPPPAPQPAPPRTSPAPTVSPPPTDPVARDIYQAAYLDFSKGNYQLAIAGFRELVRRFPESDLADKAQYLIGEAYFSEASRHATKGESDRAEKTFEQAVQEFRKVIVNYPRGEKAPTALYKEALALLELKRQSLARARLQYLLDNFPQSEEAPLARERLTSLKETG
jgi:tol-pal system protein YbgF